MLFYYLLHWVHWLPECPASHAVYMLFREMHWVSRLGVQLWGKHICLGAKFTCNSRNSIYDGRHHAKMAFWMQCRRGPDRSSGPLASRVKECHVCFFVVIFASLGLVNCIVFFQQCRLPRTQKPENLQNRSSMLITFWYVQYRSCMARSSLRDQEYCLVFQGVAGNTTRSGYLPKFHHMLRLSLDVTVQLHQILRLPGKVTFQHHCNFTKYLAVKSDTSLFFSISSVFDSILYSSLLYSILYSILRLYSTIAFLIFKTP